MTAKEFNLLCVTIGRLAPQCRQVLTLRIIYGCSCREIADRVGISKRIVHRELEVALQTVHAARQPSPRSRRWIIRAAGILSLISTRPELPRTQSGAAAGHQLQEGSQATAAAGGGGLSSQDYKNW